MKSPIIVNDIANQCLHPPLPVVVNDETTALFIIEQAEIIENCRILLGHKK